LENTGVDGRIILRLFFRKYEGVIDWLELAQVGTGCGHYAEMNLRFL